MFQGFWPKDEKSEPQSFQENAAKVLQQADLVFVSASSRVRFDK